jgi:hypothetical protein
LKGSIGVVGASVIIVIIEYNHETRFVWGLGEANNNQVEVLVLYQGL